jgi:hypothetical protein
LQRGIDVNQSSTDEVTPLGIALYHIGAATFENAHDVEGGRSDLFEASPPTEIADRELEMQIRFSSSQALKSADEIFNRESERRTTGVPSQAESEIKSIADEREAIVKILLSCPDIRHPTNNTNTRKCACVFL